MQWLTREAAGWLLGRGGQGQPMGQPHGLPLCLPLPAANILPRCSSTLYHAIAHGLAALDRAGVFRASTGDAGTSAAVARCAAVAAGGGAPNADRRSADSPGAGPAHLRRAPG